MKIFVDTSAQEATFKVNKNKKIKWTQKYTIKWDSELLKQQQQQQRPKKGEREKKKEKKKKEKNNNKNRCITLYTKLYSLKRYIFLGLTLFLFD